MALPSILHLRPAGRQSPTPAAGRTGPLADFCRRTTPAWEWTPEGIYLDLTGTERLYGRGLDGAANISRLARDFGAEGAAGTAPTRLAARLASLSAARAGGGVLAVVPAQVAVFLQSFSVDFLPGRRSVISRLAQLGVRTLGDLQVVPRALLLSVFGPAGCLLADEAWGRPTGFRSPDAPAGEGGVPAPALVVGVRLARPAASETVGAALRSGLAVRALTLCPAGPTSRGRWSLCGIWPQGRFATPLVRPPDHPGWKSWLHLVELLWRRLPARRQGFVGLELRAERAATGPFPQGNLFPADEADCRLADVMRRSRLTSGSSLGCAVEDLLATWGAVWYGPGTALPKPGRGLVDGGGSAR